MNIFIFSFNHSHRITITLNPRNIIYTIFMFKILCQNESLTNLFLKPHAVAEVKIVYLQSDDQMS